MTTAHLPLRIGLGFVLSLLGITSASAFSVSLSQGNVLRWNKSNITYHLNSACSPDVEKDQCLDALRDSFGEWMGHACANVNFQELEQTNNKKLTALGYASNGKNELAFIEDNQWTYGTYTLGVTAPVFYEDGTIFEADIVFNGLQQTWTATGENWKTDIKNVAVHEIGHFFGMQHNLGGYDPNNPPSMATTADPNLKSQSPEADDIKGLCFLQPNGSYTCSSNDDCPMVVDDGPNGEYYSGQITCTNNLCGGMTNEIPEGDAKIGEPCVGSYDCEEPLFCQQMNSGSGVCASECVPASPNCPEGFECVAFQNAPGKGVCLPEDGGPTGGDKEIGESCTGSFECKSQLCVNEAGGGFCRQQCNTDAECPDGQYCASLQGANYGACFEDGGNNNNPGDLKGLGESCVSGADCESGMCAGGGGSGYSCVKPCSTQNDCPPGTKCLELQGGGGACFNVDQKEIGEECSSPSECPTDMCISLGGPAFCTKNCVTHTDCPCGMACITTVSGNSICNIGAPKVACIPDGEPCQADSECASGVCRLGACQIACSIFMGDALCPDGESCGRMALDKPDGFCMKAGMKGTGEYCAADLACYSLFCHEGACETPCNPYGPNTCEGGLVCDAALGDVGVCSEPPPPDPNDPDPNDPDPNDPDPNDPNPNDPDPSDPDPNDPDLSDPNSSDPSTMTTVGCTTARPGPGPPTMACLVLLCLVLLRRRLT